MCTAVPEFMSSTWRESWPNCLDLQVHCFGAPRPSGPPGSPEVIAHGTWDALEGDGRHLGALRTVATDLSIAAGVEGVDLVHSHTWYANLAGHLAKLLYGIPHVVSVHSLEPLRPWKVEQLAGGYHVSRWCEQTSIEAADRVIAVSAGMAADILSVYPAVDPARLQVIHNGIDTEQYTARPRHRRARGLRGRPGPALGDLRRPDHPPEGRAPPARRRPRRSTRRPS